MSEQYQSHETLAARDVLCERQRQVQLRGCTAFADDLYVKGELAEAGAAIALIAGRPNSSTTIWPWSGKPFWPSSSRRADMVKAAALLLAEIERLDRLELVQHQVLRRDADGFWSHPGYMAGFDEEPTTEQCDDWFKVQRLEHVVRTMECDLSIEECERIQSANNDYGCVGWEPSWPNGPGWFVLSIHDTENCPVCIFGRRY